MSAVISSHPCPACGAAVAAGEVCVACALELALLGAAPEATPSVSGFADFAALELPATFGDMAGKRAPTDTWRIAPAAGTQKESSFFQ